METEVSEIVTEVTTDISPQQVTPEPWVLVKNCEDLLEKNLLLQKQLKESQVLVKQLTNKLKDSDSKFNPFSLNFNHTHYTPEQIKQALQLRFAVGWKGYKFLVEKSKNTLPSYETVCRYLRKLEFSPGLLYNLLPYLEQKVRADGDEDCLLMLDEMEIASSIELDKSSGCFYGYNTLHDLNTLGNLGYLFESPKVLM